MGHNVSPRKRSAEALRLPIFHFGGWRLDVDCGTAECHRGRSFDMRQVAGVYPRKLTLNAMPLRLRCNECARPPVGVVLRPGPGMDSRMHLAIALVGPGSV